MKQILENLRAVCRWTWCYIRCE